MSSNGSRWYTPVWEGLFAAEHCERMGPALWLYVDGRVLPGTLSSGFRAYWSQGCRPTHWRYADVPEPPREGE